MTYNAPVNDIKFVLNEVLNIGEDILSLPVFANLNSDLINTVIDEAAKFADNELAPLNRIGDKQGCKINDGVVTTPDGFKQAYKLFVENGWNSVPFSSDIGGQGLPWIVSSAISEMWSGANMAFGLCPLLTQGAVELLSLQGSAEQKSNYLAKLVSGEWTGTMCLSEPTAGSDVGAITTKATPNGNHYLIKGQKIFITYGEHDMSDNIIHMVLARTPDTANGHKGISLFIVPKILKDGTRNDVKAISIEHKLGINASPTAVLSFGENNNCVGYLMGEENQGLKYMFIMMNNARLAVGIEGIAIAENSYQQALAYAGERVQGAVPGHTEKFPIIGHPDVERMLLTIKANTNAARMLAYYTAKSLDLSHHHPDEKERARHANIIRALIPVIKAHGSDIGFEMSSLALQIFGGMGYIEETGIAQNLRDSRIAMIYEGTNGIQALDLAKRKTEFAGDFFEEISNFLRQHPNLKLRKALDHLKDATKTIQTSDNSLFNAHYYLKAFAITAGAFMMEKSAAAAAKNAGEFYSEKQKLAEFYINYILPEAECLCGLVG